MLFQQRYGDLAPALDGLVTVGVAGRAIHYVSSSLARVTDEPPAARLSAIQAWARAARDVGVEVPADIADIEAADSRGWTRLTVPGLVEEQQVRLRALADADGTVRPAYVVNVLDNAEELIGYTSAVDAVTGRVLHRHNQVQNHNGAVPVNGDTTATECGPEHEFEIPDDNSKSITFVASFVIAANDVVLKLFGPGGEPLASVDVGLSPEVLTYNSPSIPRGTYAVQVCPLEDSVNPVFLEPGSYAGTVFISDQPVPQASTPQPRWRYVTGVPTLRKSTSFVPRNFVVGCFEVGPGCDTPPGALDNPATVGAWDIDPFTDLPTFTTHGNNATTREAWTNPAAPGPLGQAPVSSTRDYSETFTDEWQNSKCDPSNLVPGGNDINAAVTNLFVAHNRMHDYTYYLGFTEENYNLQTNNYGRNTDLSRQNDPEVGQAQAAALTSQIITETGQATGRNNANQRTLQDGLPGITNQYLFQPLAGAFYAPCNDGDFDMGIVGHEYTHAISNRMIAGPDGGILSDQGGAMGESWGDLVGGEYLFAHGYPNGGSPWAVGSMRRATPRPPSATTPSTPTTSTTPMSATTRPVLRSTPTARSGAAPTGRCVRRW